MEIWSSSCEGLRFVRVPPGKSVSYQQKYVIPDTSPGPIQVYMTQRRDIFTVVEVRERGSN